jgi:hypothetical protein
MNERTTPEADDFDRNWDSYSEPWKAIEFARRLKRERDELRRMSVIEIMGENLNVKHHVTEWENRCLKAEQQRNEIQEKYDTLAVENMLEVNKLCKQRDAAMDVLSKVSHFLSCGIGDETTTAKQFGDRIIDGFVDLGNRLGEERDLARAEKTNLIKELKEAWLAMDEIEGTDRINEWQNKNAHLLEETK